MVSHGGFYLHSLVTNEAKHLFMCSLTVDISSLENSLLRSFARFLTGLFIFLLSNRSSLYSLDTRPIR